MQKKRTLVPRSRDSIFRQLESDNEVKTYTSMRGDISINPALKNVRHLKLNSYKKGKTVIRIWPMMDPEQPGERLLNGRLTDEDVTGLGGMSISEPVFCVQYAGITKNHGNFLTDPKKAEPCSYIIARNKDHVVEGVGFWQEPYVLLQVTAKRAMMAGEFADGRAWDPRWNKLLPPNNNPAISPFKQMYFVVCSVYNNGPNLDLVREHEEYTSGSKTVNKDHPRDGIPLGEAPGDPMIVMQIPTSAGKSILKLACTRKEDWVTNSKNPSATFKYGDPTGIFDPTTNTVKGGLFFTLFNPEVCKEKFKHCTNSESPSDKGFPGYEAAVTTIYEGPNGNLSANLAEDQVKHILEKHLFFWKESEQDPADSYLLHEPSIEERCVMLAKAFHPVPKLLEFAWLSNPEYLDFESVRGILRNRTTVAVTKPTRLDEPEDEDEDDDQVLHQQKRFESAAKAKPAAPIKPTASNKSAASLVDDFDEDELDEELDEDELEDDFEEEEEVKPKSKAKAAPAKAKPAKSKPVVEEEDDDLEDDDLEEDDDDLDDADEAAASEDFDAFDDEVDNSDAEDQLNNSLSKAKAISRSSKRVITPEPVKPPTKRKAR